MSGIIKQPESTTKGKRTSQKPLKGNIMEKLIDAIAEYKNFCIASRYDGRRAEIMLNSETLNVWVDMFTSGQSFNVYDSEAVVSLSDYAGHFYGEITTQTLIQSFEDFKQGEILTDD